MKDGGITRRNPYSLMSDPMDQHSYAISVRRDDEGRGGSLFMHNNVKVSDDMVLSYPVNLFHWTFVQKTFDDCWWYWNYTIYGAN